MRPVRRAHPGAIIANRLMIGVTRQSAGAPIVDRCSALARTIDDETGREEHEWWYGVAIRHRARGGRAIVIARPGPLLRFGPPRFLPRVLTRSRGHLV